MTNERITDSDLEHLIAIHRGPLGQTAHQVRAALVELQQRRVDEPAERSLPHCPIHGLPLTGIETGVMVCETCVEAQHHGQEKAQGT